MVNEANKAVHTDAVDEHEEMDFAAMLEESFKDSERDALINGVVVAIKEDVILVDVGKKSEGRLNASEVMDEEGNITCKIGDVISIKRYGRYKLLAQKSITKSGRIVVIIGKTV